MPPSVQKHRVNVSLEVPLIFLKEKGRHIAFTPALDVTTSGKTLVEAKRNFEEAIQLFVEELIEMGTVDEALTELGWTKKKNQPWKSSIEVSEAQKVPLKVLVPA